MWKVYFLKSNRKNWFYVGSTNNISRRLREHKNGRVKSSKPYLPLELIHTINCVDETKARNLEKRIKKQRLLKESIIRSIDV